MEAFFEKDGMIFELLHIKKEEMDDILKDKIRRELKGYPLYFDLEGRLWPKDLSIKVEFRDQSR